MSLNVTAESALALPGPSQSVRDLASHVKSYASYLSAAMVDASGRPTDSYASLPDAVRIDVAGKMLETAKVVQVFLDTDQDVKDWTSPSSFRQQATNTAQHVGGALRSFVQDFLAPIGAVSYLPAAKNLSAMIASGGGSPAVQRGVAILKSVPALKNLVAVLSLVPQNKDIENHGKSKNDPVVAKFIAAIPHLSSSIQSSLTGFGMFTRKAADQAEKLLAGHPEAVNNVMNAAGFFTYNKTPVVENPGESSVEPEKPSPQSQYSLTGSDILGLATYAASIIDPRVAAGKGAVAGAILDAVLRAVAEKDGGVYAGKVSSSTMDLIIDHATKLAGGKKMAKPENQNSRYRNLAAKGAKDDPTSEIPGASISTYSNPVSVPKEASSKAKTAPVKSAEPKSDTSVLDTLMGLGAGVAGKSQGAASAQIKKTVQTLPANIRTKLSADMDRIATALQHHGMAHLAEAIDAVTNAIEEKTHEEDSY